MCVYISISIYLSLYIYGYIYLGCTHPHLPTSKLLGDQVCHTAMDKVSNLGINNPWDCTSDRSEFQPIPGLPFLSY